MRTPILFAGIILAASATACGAAAGPSSAPVALAVAKPVAATRAAVADAQITLDVLELI